MNMLADRKPIFAALDLATKSGVAYGRPAGKPGLETWKFGEGSHGERGLELMRQLDNLIEGIRPDAIFIEKPLSPRVLVEIGAKEQTALLLPGLVMVAVTVCAARKVRTELCDRQDVLAHFTGRRKYPGEQNGAKQACMARCQQLGWRPENFDEADAAALWDYGCMRLQAQIMMGVEASRPPRVRRAPSSSRKDHTGDRLF